jgi:hypothetical protein
MIPPYLSERHSEDARASAIYMIPKRQQIPPIPFTQTDSKKVT